MEEIKKALSSLNIQDWILRGEPTNEAEFNQMFRKITSFGDRPSEQVESDDPADFGVTWDEIQAEITRAEAEYVSLEYARDRAAAYPSLGDQLDMIFHAGLGGDEFQAAIQAVKDEHPKPE